jgi:hypothetical protein
MYATTDSQVFRTVNRGSSWADVSPTGVGRIDGVAVDPANLKTVYVSAESASIVLDSGDTWNLIRRAEYGSSIGVARDGSPQLWVSAAGAAASLDQGDSWRELSTKGSNFAFNSLWDIVASRDSCFMVSDLVGLPGQILVYEIPRPRRRAASHS